MADLTEGQWELNGFLFGVGTNYRLRYEGLEFGSADMRVQDVARPQGDGSLMGRDFVGGPEMLFTIRIRHGLEVWPLIDEFQQAWRADNIRSQPGALSVLRYRRRGVTYRYLGRSRKFDLVPVDHRRDEWQDITATFQLHAPEKYVEPEDASKRSLTLRLVQSDPDGGLVVPAVVPWELRQRSQARVGEVTVGGYRPAPFRVVVHGPVDGTLSGIVLSGDGWRIESSATLQHDETLVIDTATNTITKGGVSQAGSLSRMSRLTSRLAVGYSFVRFDAVDPTNTAYAVVTWNDTLPA